jgi:hypothetical protein
MRRLRSVVPLACAASLVAAAPPAARTADCAADAAGTRCLYRSLAPSSGIVTVCRGDRDCRVGYYYGDPAAPVWFPPPPGLSTLPNPEVTWRTATLAEVRVGCGPSCAFSYFFEVKRRRVSEPRANVLDADPRRLLVVAAEDRALVVRQMFSGRVVTRIERDWAPGPALVEAVTRAHFDPDGRLALTWLRGPERSAVSERVTVPSFAKE